MDSRLLAKYIIYFIILYLLQIFLFNYAAIGTGMFATIYILIILLLPADTEKNSLLLIAFIIGLILDFSNDTVAINTGALVFATYLRPLTLSILSPRDGYETGKNLSAKNYGFSWFLWYSLIFTFAFELAYFSLSIFKISAIGTIFVKSIITTLYSATFIIILHLLFFRNK